MKEKQKTPIFKKKWFWIVIAVLLIIGTIGNAAKDDDSDVTEDFGASQSVETSAPPQDETAEPTESTDSNPTQEPSGDDELSDTQNILDLDTVMAIARISLSQNFGDDNYTLEYDDTGATINIWGDNVALGATLAAAGDEDAKESWDNLVEAQKTLCNTFVGQVESAGIENYYITLNVLNDTNKSNTLLTVLNGVVVYDAVNG